MGGSQRLAGPPRARPADSAISPDRRHVGRAARLPGPAVRSMMRLPRQRGQLLRVLPRHRLARSRGLHAERVVLRVRPRRACLATLLLLGRRNDGSGTGSGVRAGAGLPSACQTGQRCRSRTLGAHGRRLRRPKRVAVDSLAPRATLRPPEAAHTLRPERRRGSLRASRPAHAPRAVTRLAQRRPRRPSKHARSGGASHGQARVQLVGLLAELPHLQGGWGGGGGGGWGQAQSTSAAAWWWQWSGGV